MVNNKRAPWSIVFILTLILTITFAEDSLRSALNAVTRRQRDLSDLSKYGDYYNDGYDDNDDITFLNPSNNNNNYSPDSRNIDYERNLLDFIEENGVPNRGDFTKRISSSFRERVEEDKERQRKQIAEFLFNRLINERETKEDEEYEKLLFDLWNKYRKEYQSSSDTEDLYPLDDIKKRGFPNYYPSLGWESVGMRKRNRYFEPDGPSESLYLLNYSPREEYYNRYLDDNDNVKDVYNSKFNNRDRKYDVNLQLPYITKKRFPVTKRSSNYFTSTSHGKEDNKPKKKQILLKTDPKVAEELSNIFSSPKEKSDKIKSTTVKPKKSAKKNDMTTEIPVKNTNNSTLNKIKIKPTEKKIEKQTDRRGNKEVAPDHSSKDKPLQIKKKSINWSDYFGLDRKKKSGNGLDNEWLMERYHKAVAMATKRSTDHNHEIQKENSYIDEKKNTKTEDAKISEMDAKLKNIEDSIIDDAVKFTGAHEGAVDSKEIQEVKDKVMSRLAAAYNLEKMRRALDEYRVSIEKEKNRLKELGTMTTDDTDDFLLERKRVSVPRKQAIDEEREKIPESDNNIRCTQNDEECDEQNYKIPSELLDRPEWDKEACPKVQRACNEVATVLGHYGRVFEAACNIHQLCLLCGENSWFAPTRHCNVLFLSKATELCEDDMECQNVARRSVRYLLDVNRSLRAEPLKDCDIICPENR